MEKTEKKDESKNHESLNTWYSWDSPIGLGIFCICVAVAFMITVKAISSIFYPGHKGIMVEKQMKYMPR